MKIAPLRFLVIQCYVMDWDQHPLDHADGVPSRYVFFVILNHSFLRTVGDQTPPASALDQSKERLLVPAE